MGGGDRGAPGPGGPAHSLPDPDTADSGSVSDSSEEWDHCSTTGAAAHIEDAVWGSNPQPVALVSEKWGLPRLARIHSEDPELLADDQDSAGVLDHPILLYSMHRRSKVLATSVRWDAAAGEHRDVGPQLVIPVNYTGWFHYLQDGGAVGEPLATVDAVAARRAEVILVHKTVIGYRYDHKIRHGARLYLRVRVAAGEVLVVKGVCQEAFCKQALRVGGCGGALRRALFRKRSGWRKRNSLSSDVCNDQVYYVQCVNSLGKEVLLKFGTEGEFYEVGERGQKVNFDAVYQLNDIVCNVKLPAILKLSHGKQPTLPESQFTGLFKLHELFFEESVVGCVLGDSKQSPCVLEIPTDSDIQLVPADNWNALKDSAWVVDTFQHCEENYDGFVNSIKVLQNAYPDTEPQEELEDRADDDGTMMGKQRVVERALPPVPPSPEDIALPKRKKDKKKLTRSLPWRRKHKNSKYMNEGLPNEWTVNPETEKSYEKSNDPDYEVIPFHLKTVEQFPERKRSVESSPEASRGWLLPGLAKTPQHRQPGLTQDSTVYSNHRKNDTVARMEMIDAWEEGVGTGVPNAGVELDDEPVDVAEQEGEDEAGYLMPQEVTELMDRSPGTTTRACSSVRSYQDLHNTSSSTCTLMAAAGHADQHHVPGGVHYPAPPLHCAPPAPPLPALDGVPAHYDRQRLDAFLADSVHELQRRQQDADSVTSSRRLRLHKSASVPTIEDAQKKEIPNFQSQDQLHDYLDKIFDCSDQSEVSDDVLPQVEDELDDCLDELSISQRLDKLTVSRSLSVPAMRGELYETRDPCCRSPRTGSTSGGSHAAGSSGGTPSQRPQEYGYHTTDSGISGIWVNAYTGSDTYRMDSTTYRSTSDCSWSPPEDLEPLTVEEVGMSLRYIGMKEHVVVRFCEEQIDGKQLAELNDELLCEGFPELNGLERKKLRDFINGWRPKKWSSTT